MIDCGINVGSEDNGSPFLNVPEVLPLETLDSVVITHAHLDHSALVPFLYKYGYDGPIYCTPPTRDLMSLLQLDYLKVAVGEGRKTPYESKDIREAVKHCIPLRYGDTTDISADIRLTFQNAGHILGSAIAHFHIGDGLHNVAISGDIKYEKTWLFNAAVNKFPRLETLIVESTYGGHQDYQPHRKEAAQQLKRIIHQSLRREGKVLIPVFAVGRSQEVMIVLEQLMRTREIPDVTIYLDGMIMEATAIHTAYPEYLNNQLRTQIFQRGDNPFLSETFKHVDNVEKREKICDDTDPCIVLATSGMLNGGPVMEYLKAFAPSKKNTFVFVGYQAEGTLGRKIQKGSKDVQIREKGKPVNVEIKFNVETCDGFSGHSDRKQLLNYIYNLDPKPERIIMCHGEESKCSDLASTVYQKYGVETRPPMNLETIRLV
jgi:KH/beta-lactamase-domain protein